MLADLEAVLDQMAGADPAALADAESMVGLQRCLARLEAVVARAAAAFDASGQWEADGARSPAAWLAGRCRVPKAAASGQVHLGRALRHLPAAEEAWLGGEVGRAHVAALAGARTPATCEAMARDEEMLVGQARTLRHDQFVRVLHYWAQHADPDGTEDAAARQRDERRLHLSQTFAGAWVGDLVLDPVAGTVVADQLRRIEDELFGADWAEPRPPPGPSPRGPSKGACRHLIEDRSCAKDAAPRLRVSAAGSIQIDRMKPRSRHGTTRASHSTRRAVLMSFSQFPGRTMTHRYSRTLPG